MGVIQTQHLALKVADEVFVVVADLHRRNPSSADFSVGVIMEHARMLNLTGVLRPGIEIHVRQHAVANLAPNGGRYRILYESGKARRRLLLAVDHTHPERRGKIWPEERELPAEFHGLLQWAKQRFADSPPLASPIDALLALRGSGKTVWADEHADDYVRRLRADWP